MFLIQISLTIFAQDSNWQYVSLGLGNGLAPYRRQAIIWRNIDQNVFMSFVYCITRPTVCWQRTLLNAIGLKWFPPFKLSFRQRLTRLHPSTTMVVLDICRTCILAVLIKGGHWQFSVPGFIFKAASQVMRVVNTTHTLIKWLDKEHTNRVSISILI